MAVLVSPGVLTREIDFSLYAPALSTTILGIVGTATKGPTNSAELITNGAQLQEVFGGPHPNHPAILTAQMYLKYGRQLRFVRVGAANDLLAADYDLPSASAGPAVVQGSSNGTFNIAAAVNASILGTEVGPYTIVRPTAAVVTSDPETYAITEAVAASHTGSADQNFTISEATTPQVTGSQTETFNIQAGVNDVIRLAMDGGAPSDITLTAGGARTAANICTDINAVFPGVASPSAGAVRLTSTTSGAAASIDIQAVANDAYTALGLVAATTQGVAGTNLLRIKVDGGANQDVTLTSGSRTAAQIVTDIGLVVTGATASVSGGTKVKIASDLAGAGSSIQLVAITNSAYATLGWTVATYTGSAGSNKLRIAIDGGANQDFTLTAGGARTAAQIVTDLAALTGATASVFGSSVRITTTTINGTSSSIEVKTLANSAHAALGLALAVTQGDAGNSWLKIAVDGGADQEVNLTAGVGRAAIDIVNEINSGTNGLTAAIDASKIRITSNGIGAASSIEIVTTLNNAYATLGYSVATTTGSNGNDVLLISVDRGGNQTIQLTAGAARTAAQVASDINAQVSGAVAATFNSGARVQIASSSTGTGAYIQVQAASTADTPLGLDNAEHAGTAAGSTSFSAVALTAGVWGNEISVKILDDASYAGMKILQVLYKGVVMEIFKNLSKSPSAARFYETIINGSSEYITVLDNPAQPSHPVNGTYVLAGGTDGLNGIADADYIGTESGGTRTGLQMFSDPTTMDLNLVMVPGVTSMAVHAAVASLCEVRHDSFGIVDPEAALTPTQVVDFLKGQGSWAGSRVSLNSSYVAMYYPWVKLYDSTNATITTMPPSAAAIRAIAFNDVAAEVWTAPAGVNRGRITEAVGIERTLTNGERDYLYENRINPIANFPADGVVIWGQKTLQVAPTALDRVNVRRLLLYVRKVVATAVVPLIFEPNTPRLWRRFINLVTPTFRDIKQREGLNDFRVVCDETTNTPVVIDRSEFRARIFIKPTKAAEFIIVDFVLVNQSSTFNEFEQGV